MCNEKNGNLPATRPNVLMTADPAAIAAAETVKARISAAYLVAMQNPRNEDQARQRILKACRRPLFAERVEYAKPQGGTTISGPSVRFAELAIREWGNVLAETQVVYEDNDHRRVKVTLIDLETNTSFSKEIQVRRAVERRGNRKNLEDQGREILGERKNSSGQTVFTVRATDEEMYQKEAALISKAVRNEGLRIIPADIIDEGIEVARGTCRQRDAADPDATKKAVLDAFAGLGIMPEDVEGFLGHKMAQTNQGEIEVLRGIYQAIKEGTATWADIVAQPGTNGDVKEKSLSKAEELKKDIAAAKNGAGGGSGQAHDPEPREQAPAPDQPPPPDQQPGPSGTPSNPPPGGSAAGEVDYLAVDWDSKDIAGLAVSGSAMFGEHKPGAKRRWSKWTNLLEARDVEGCRQLAKEQAVALAEKGEAA